MKYVSLKSLGSIGDMCSQMQQYASLYAIAKENNAEIVLPESTKNEGHGVRLFNILDIPHTYQPNEFFEDFKVFNIDTTKEVDERSFQLGDGSYFIDGRFDLFKYWHPKYEKDVFDWKIHEHLKLDARNYIQSLKQKYDVSSITSIHIRLGDYLLPQHQHFARLFETNYYNDAIQIINSEQENLFIVFTNDIDWCKNNIIGEDGVFVNSGNDNLDFTIMSECDNNIIANSSYSWWAAFKNSNPNKTVVCPKNYLRNYSQFKHINGNYFPSNWISIDNYNG